MGFLTIEPNNKKKKIMQRASENQRNFVTFKEEIISFIMSDDQFGTVVTSAGTANLKSIN